MTDPEQNDESTMRVAAKQIIAQVLQTHEKLPPGFLRTYLQGLGRASGKIIAQLEEAAPSLTPGEAILNLQLQVPTYLTALITALGVSVAWAALGFDQDGGEPSLEFRIHRRDR